MHIVLIATEWGPGLGGINAFNQELAKGLAHVGGNVVNVSCGVTNWSIEAAQDAQSAGVLLIPIKGDEQHRPLKRCGDEILLYLKEQHLPAEVDVWVGHDVISGDAAVEASKSCGRVALIHHMDYFDYQNLDGGLGAKAATNHKKQTQLFSTENAILFGVGSELAESARRLSANDTRACSLVPGFPSSFKKNTSPEAAIRGVVAGRFEMASEPLKQSKLAAAAFGAAIRRAAGKINAFDNPSMSFIGVEEALVGNGELEEIVRAEAGRVVNVVPSKFELDPDAVVAQLCQSNLAIMPSYREGFGLAGWEAIGCEVPLVLGRETGLYKFIESVLGGAGTGCVFGVGLVGGDRNEKDVATVAAAIEEIGKDLPKARSNARRLKNQLIAELGCTWANTARLFFSHLGQEGGESLLFDASEQSGQGAQGSPLFQYSHFDHFPLCAELRIGAGQGSTSQRFDLLVELRFGTAQFRVGTLDAEVYLRRAYLQVIPSGGVISGERLGDPPITIKGVEPRAGGRWIISDPSGGEMMTHKALGDEVLCRIENPYNVSAGVAVELTSARSDIGCIFTSLPGKRNVEKSTSKVMQLFLQKSIIKEPSGHIVISQAQLNDE